MKNWDVLASNILFSTLVNVGGLAVDKMEKVDDKLRISKLSLPLFSAAFSVGPLLVLSSIYTDNTSR